MATPFPTDEARRILRFALDEDVRTGDITCLTVLPAGHRNKARITAKEPGILAGLPLVPLVIEELASIDPASDARSVTWRSGYQDGQPFQPGATLVEFEGPVQAILELERVLLNLLQHLCGVAQAAHTYQKAAGPDCKVLDTRKTTPGQRSLEKWAIVQGGGSNHRMGLWDAILVKENHVAAVGGVRDAALKALSARPDGMDVIVEVRTMDELGSLCDLPLTRVLLDNFTPDGIRQARELRDIRHAGFALEASGGIRLDTIASYARAGAEFISVGALTHSVAPVDLSLLLEGT